MKTELVKLLSDLLSRVEGCSDPGCLVCEGVREKIDRLADILELSDAERLFITPNYLRRLSVE